MSPTTLVFIFTLVPCFCQRPFYAGTKPIGFPEVVSSGLEDRYGDQIIPAQLNGDREYANKLNNLPQDKQPFFFVNKEHIANNLNNPQTYPQRPSGFNPNAGK